MSHEGKEEKEVMKAVYCAGIKKLMKAENCNDECLHFAGIKKEPIKEKVKRVVTVIGYNEFVLCKFPKLEKIHSIFEV